MSLQPCSWYTSSVACLTHIVSCTRNNNTRGPRSHTNAQRTQNKPNIQHNTTCSTPRAECPCVEGYSHHQCAHTLTLHATEVSGTGGFLPETNNKTQTHPETGCFSRWQCVSRVNCMHLHTQRVQRHTRPCSQARRKSHTTQTHTHMDGWMDTAAVEAAIQAGTQNDTRK